jgi:two-component system chemotaxis response regulator CheB
MARVVVVDDSQFMRVQIREILEEGGHDIVTEASNGNEGVEAVEEHEPDVVTMDVKMPGMDGISAVEHIMETVPTPVLMLSRYTGEGADTTLEALDAGAVDFMLKPDGEVTTGLVEYADDLVELVSVVAEADVDPVGEGRQPSEPSALSPISPEPALLTADWETPPTLVVAASTGGPSEIHTIFRKLPGAVGLRVLVVQHMPEPFTDRFANRLDELSTFEVCEAAQGDRVGPNEVAIAKGDNHLEVDGEVGEELSVSLTDDPPVHSVRPAADVTLQSAAETVDGPVIALVLSGMGRDSAAGVEAVEEAGGRILVQAPEDASIASMPERAIETGSVDEVVSTEKIPDAILDELRKLAADA